jgi:hypothetical protein
MHIIHLESDLEKLRNIQNKKNILIRFMMDGCVWCKRSQDEWEQACERAPISSDDAIVDLESNFINHFNQVLKPRNISVDVSAFPTLMIIKGRKIITPEQDIDKVLKMFVQRGGSKRRTRKLKSRKRRHTF